MTPRDRLQQLIDELDEERVEAFLLLLTTPAQAAELASERTSGSEESSDDPFGGLVGMIGDEYDGPTDVSANIHKYVADAIEAEWKH